MLANLLLEKIISTQNPSVIGLDTKFDYLPSAMQEKYIEQFGSTLNCAANGILDFNKALIDSLYDIIPAVKVQSAYYEMYGYDGVRAFHDTCSYAKRKGLFVIADAKRNDIGPTASAYSSAFIGITNIGGQTHRAFDADFVTVNPFFGSDGLQPFIDDCTKHDKGLFILVKTSNPSSGEYQDMILSGSGAPLYSRIADNIASYESETGKYGFSNIGAVVGATYPEIAASLRKQLPKSILLVPGYGAQGGDPKLLSAFFTKDGIGAIVNSSRAILLAYKELKTDDFRAAAREKAIIMREEINGYITRRA